MKTRWFKRKAYGWGWTPSTWQGWSVTAIYALVLVKLFIAIGRRSSSLSDALIGFIMITMFFKLVSMLIGESPAVAVGGKT